MGRSMRTLLGCFLTVIMVAPVARMSVAQDASPAESAARAARIEDAVRRFLPNAGPIGKVPVNEGAAVFCRIDFVPSTEVAEISVDSTAGDLFDVQVVAKFNLRRCRHTPLPGLESTIILQSPWEPAPQDNILGWGQSTQWSEPLKNLSPTNGVVGELVHSELFKLNFKVKFNNVSATYDLEQSSTPSVVSYGDSGTSIDSYVGLAEGSPMVFGSRFPEKFQ